MKWNQLTIHYFHVFGCKCFILNKKDNLGKFDSKIDYGVFLGYSQRSKAYRVYNNNSRKVEETMHVVFCEFDQDCVEKVLEDVDAGKQ